MIERIEGTIGADTVSFDSWPSKRTRGQMEAGLESLMSAGDSQHRAHFHEWLLTAIYNREKLIEEIFRNGTMDCSRDLQSRRVKTRF